MFKVVYCGTPNISVEILKELEENKNIEIVGVITQPDKTVGRNKELKASPVKEYSLEKGYKLFQPIKISEIYDELKNLQPDFMLTCAYGQFINQTILDLFKNCLNVHASLLPKYRGGSPIQYSILNGDKTTGISLIKMIKKMDAGEIYHQSEIEIDDNDNSETLFEKMSILGRNVIREKLLDIFNQKNTGIEQDESKVTFAYNLKNEEEQIDWNKSAFEVRNFIRALSPQPVAFTYVKNERIKINLARLIRDDELLAVNLKIFQTGEIIAIDKEGIVVNTGSGYLKILELQREGKKMVNAGTFNNSQSNIKVGNRFIWFKKES